MEILFVRHAESTENVAHDNGIKYDPLNVHITKHGEKQATVTGKYLKTFGKFDAIYCSPFDRCIETCDIIVKQLKYGGKIIYDDRLRENNWGIVDGMSKDDRKNYLKSDKKLIVLSDLCSKEKNTFKLLKLFESFIIEQNKHTASTRTINECIDDINSFLNMIKKQKFKRILVVTHGGIFDCIKSIVTNTSIFNMQLNICLESQPKMVERSNCMIMGLTYSNKTYELVIPPNNLHLV